MDEKSDEPLSGVDGEAMLTPELGNSDSFVAGAESLSDSFKSFISSPAADSEALVDTLISDSTVTSKDEEEVPTNLDCQEHTEVNQIPTSSTETVTTTSDDAITTSDTLTVATDTTTNISEPTASSNEITTSSEKVEDELCVSEASTLTLTAAHEPETEPEAVSDEQVIGEPEQVECKPDMLSKALEAMDTDILDSTEEGLDKIAEEPQSSPQAKQDVDVKDEEVPVSKVPEEALNDSRTVPEWKSKDDTMCDLEEELKRLHEGDTPESEAIIESSLSLHPAVTMAKKTPISTVNGPTAVAKVSRIVPIEEDKPILKDSDLEEMLAADVILKDADLIQQSQKDLKTTDLLVCGRCHEVFHFVEEFQRHKSSPCLTTSKVLSACENESKPQVWGFTLWKNKQFKLVKPGAPLPSSWNVYQKWCKMAENDKKAWIAAGQTLQFCNRIGLAKLTEVKVKSPQKTIEKDPLALDGFMENKENTSSPPVRSLRVNKEIAILPKEVNKENTNRALRTVRSTETKEFAVEKIVAKRFNPKRKTWEYNIKWEHFPSEDNTWEPVANLSHCKKMIDQFEEQLKKLKMEKAKQAANISKVKVKKDTPIVYSPPSSSRTPSSTGRPQRQCKQKALSQVKAWCGNISDDEDGAVGGLKRPYEDDDSDESYEKKMKFEDETDDSDFESKAQVVKLPNVKKEPITPKATPIVVKNGTSKGTPLPENILIPDANGVVRINQKQLPSLSTGVYIMSKTAGIIKLDSATSKVATSGGPTVVKVTPKIGQTQIKIVKKDGSTTGTQQVIQYSPKTGVHQTQQVLRITPKMSTPVKSTPTKVFKPVITKVKKLSDIAPADTKDASKAVVETSKIATTDSSPKKATELKKIAEVMPKAAQKIKTALEKQRRSLSVSEPPTADEESDDGLEELPFPDDIKVPEPESPQGDFSLDPFTGKLAGVEYPDPVPEPEPTPVEEEKADESSLDNIVKLAAADITEEDLKADTTEAPMELEPEPVPEPEPEQLIQPMEDDKEKNKPKSSPLVIRKTDLTPASIAAVAAKPIMRVTMASTPIKRSTPASILNRALTGSPQVIRKTIVNSPALVGQQRVQQRILNPTLNRTTVLNPIIRTGNTYARAKQTAPKPKFNIATYNSPARLAKAAGTPVLTKATYVTKVSPQSMGRKIGSTTIRSTPIINQIKPQTRIVHASPNKYSLHKGKESLLLRGHPDRRSMTLPQKPKPKTVISMPSLIGDDDSMSPLSMGEPMVTMKTSPQIQTMMEQEPEIHMPAVETPIINSSTPTVMDPIITPVTEAAVAGTSSNVAVHHEQQQPELAADMSSFTLADSDNPIFITGDDGTVYQVAGQNEQGQTILLTQDANGQQQCLLVTNELAENMETPVAEQPQVAESPVANISIPEITPEVTEPLQVKTDQEDTSDQVVAQVVRAEPPSPGGTHKVVVMLPDGNLMVTHVSPEEYASLELD